MSLANLVIRSIKVSYDANTEIELFGLSANDVAGIIISQQGALERVFDVAEGLGIKGVDDIARVDVAKLGMELLAQLPEFLGHVIAYAAHEPEYAYKVMQLDAPTQIRMVRAVAELSFRDAAGFQEFVGNVAAAMRSAKGVLPLLNKNPDSNDSRNGGSASAMQSRS